MAPRNQARQIPLRIERDEDSVRLATRGGSDWTKHYLWIAEAARKDRQKRFVLNGEAVILGEDGISDFPKGLVSKHRDRPTEALDQDQEPEAFQRVMESHR